MDMGSFSIIRPSLKAIQGKSTICRHTHSFINQKLPQSGAPHLIANLVQIAPISLWFMANGKHD